MSPQKLSVAFQQGRFQPPAALARAACGLLLMPPQKRTAAVTQQDKVPVCSRRLNTSSHRASLLKCLADTIIMRVSGKTEIVCARSQFPKNCIIKPGRWPSLHVVVCFLRASVLCFILPGSMPPRRAFFCFECSATNC